MLIHRTLFIASLAYPGLVVMAQLEVGPLPTAVWCAGSSFEVPFTATGTFDPGNSFIVELSDASGVFAPGTPIGSLASDVSGTVSCSTWGIAATGTGYLVRVRSTSPAYTSAAGSSTLTLASPNAGMDGFLTNCTNGPAIALNTALGGSPQPGGTWSDLNATGALVGGVLQPALASGGTYTFTYTVNAAGCTDQATVTVVLNIAPNAGTNAAITVCSTGPPFTMYQALGGSPGAGGAWTSPAGAQMNGLFDPSTDPPGLYAYTVVGDPPCLNETATLSITVSQAPNAGLDGSAEVCSPSAPINLFDILEGTPGVGGTWVGPSPIGNGIYIPGTLDLGVYTYIVQGAVPCLADSASVTVTGYSAVDAGISATVVTCTTSPPFDLLEALSGSPDAGGAWVGPSPVGNGVFDPASMIPGIYTYTVPGTAPCPDASAAVTVVMNQAPNAGTDGSATYCATDPAFPLLQHLGGSPSPAGTWVFNSVPHGPIFVPGTDGPGEYVYTVLGASPCGTATATVTVSQVTCLVNTPVTLGIPNVTE